MLKLYIALKTLRLAVVLAWGNLPYVARQVLMKGSTNQSNDYWLRHLSTSLLCVLFYRKGYYQNDCQVNQREGTLNVASKKVVLLGRI